MRSRTLKLKRQIAAHHIREQRRPARAGQIADDRAKQRASPGAYDGDQRMAEKDSPQVIELLIKFYDTETGMEAERYLLQALGQSRQKTALQKLINVARADASVEMRKQAVRMLGESKDPEALKFVEELLK
ncbi:MAG: HEAT repeat domain-containing protein [Pyrinomonadaceae bacterium]